MEYRLSPGSCEQDNDPLRGASCVGLPYQVVDKYFMSSKAQNPWEFRTAILICGRCLVKATCLEDAITHATPTLGVRAGQGHNTLQDLRTEYLEGVPVQELVTRIMTRDAKKRTTFLRIRHPKPGSNDEIYTNFGDFPPMRDTQLTEEENYVQK